MESSQMSQNYFDHSLSHLSQSNQWDQWGFGYSNYSNSNADYVDSSGSTNGWYHTEKNSLNSQYSCAENSVSNQVYCDHKGASVSLISESEGVYYYSCFLCGNSGYYNQFGNVQYDERTKTFHSFNQVQTVDTRNGGSTGFSVDLQYERSQRNIPTSWNENTSKIPETLPVESLNSSTTEQNSKDSNSGTSQVMSSEAYSNHYLSIAEPTAYSSENSISNLASRTDQNGRDMTESPSALKFGQECHVENENSSAFWKSHNEISEVNFHANTDQGLCSRDATFNQELIQSTDISHEDNTDGTNLSENVVQNGTSYTDDTFVASINKENKFNGSSDTGLTTSIQTVQNTNKELPSTVYSTGDLEENYDMAPKLSLENENSWNNDFRDLCIGNKVETFRIPENVEVQFSSQEMYDNTWNNFATTDTWNDVDFDDPNVLEKISFSSKAQEMNTVAWENDFNENVESQVGLQTSLHDENSAINHNVSSNSKEVFTELNFSTRNTAPNFQSGKTSDSIELNESCKNEVPSCSEDGDVDTLNSNFSTVIQNGIDEVEILDEPFVLQQMKETHEVPSTSDEELDKTMENELTLADKYGVQSSNSPSDTENKSPHAGASNIASEILFNGPSDVNCWSNDAWSSWAENGESCWNDIEENEIVVGSTNEPETSEERKSEDEAPESCLDSNDEDFLSGDIRNCNDVGSIALDSEDTHEPRSLDAEVIENIPLANDEDTEEDPLNSQQQDEGEVASDESKNTPSEQNKEGPAEMTVHDCISMYSECLHDCRTVTDVYNERIWYLQNCPRSETETGFEKVSNEITDQLEGGETTERSDLNSIEKVPDEIENDTPQSYEVHLTPNFDKHSDQKEISNEQTSETKVLDDVVSLDRENPLNEKENDRNLVATSYAAIDGFQTWNSSGWDENVDVPGLETSQHDLDDTVKEMEISATPEAPEDIAAPDSKQESGSSNATFPKLEEQLDEARNLNELNAPGNSGMECNLTEEGWNTTWDNQIEPTESCGKEAGVLDSPELPVAALVPEIPSYEQSVEKSSQSEKLPEFEPCYENTEKDKTEYNTFSEQGWEEGWGNTWTDQPEEGGDWQNNWNSSSEPGSLNTGEESSNAPDAVTDLDVNFGGIDFDNIDVNGWQFSEWNDMPECGKSDDELANDDENLQPVPSESEVGLPSEKTVFQDICDPTLIWDPEQQRWTPIENVSHDKLPSMASTLSNTNGEQSPVASSSAWPLQNKLSSVPEAALSSTGIEVSPWNEKKNELNPFGDDSNSEFEAVQEIEPLAEGFAGKWSDKSTEKLQDSQSTCVTNDNWDDDGWNCSFEANADEVKSVPVSPRDLQNSKDPEAQIDFEEELLGQEVEPGKKHFDESSNLNMRISDSEFWNDVESNSNVENQLRNDFESFSVSHADENVQVSQQVPSIDGVATKTDETKDECFDAIAATSENQWGESEWGWGWDNDDTFEERTAVETIVKTPEKTQNDPSFSAHTNKVEDALTNSNVAVTSIKQSNNDSFPDSTLQECQTVQIESISSGLDQAVTPPAKTMIEVLGESRMEKPSSSGVASTKLIDVKSLKVSPSYAMRKTGKKPLSALATDESKMGKLDISDSCIREESPIIPDSDLSGTQSPVLPAVPVLDHRTAKTKKSNIERSKLSKATKVDILPDRAKLNSSTAAVADLEENKSSIEVSVLDIAPEESNKAISIVNEEPENKINEDINTADNVPTYYTSAIKDSQLDFPQNATVSDGQSSPKDSSNMVENSCIVLDSNQANVEANTTVQDNNPPILNTTTIPSSVAGNSVENYFNNNPSNASFSSESTIHSGPNMNRSFPMYHHQAPVNVDPYYNQSLLNPYSSPDTINHHTPIGIQPSYQMGAPINMHLAAFEQMRMLNWQQMQYKMYMDQLYVYMNKQKRLSKLKQIHNRRGRSKKNYDSCYTEDTTTESVMSSDKDFTELETSSVETEDALDAVEHTKEHIVRIHSAKRGTKFFEVSKKNIRHRGCVARFSANGKFVFTDNFNAEASQLFCTSRVDPLPKAFASFPGPLGRDRTQKLAVKEYLLKRLHEAEFAGNKDLVTVLNYMVLLVKQNGAICGTDISEILLSEESEGGYDQNVEDSVMNLPEGPLNPISINKLTHYASSGKDANLIRSASENNSWGLALRFAALSSDRELERQVFNDFDGKCSPDAPVDPMITFLLIKEKRKFPEVFLKNCWRNWREHVAVILSNPTNNQEYDKACFEVIGDALASKGLNIPAQFCYILACLPLSLPWEPNAKFVLLGTSAKSSFDMMNDFESILLTLIFEYAVHLGNQEVCFPSLQFFKFHLSGKMVDCGMKNKAIDFCLDTCAEVSANHIHFPTSFLSQLRDLAYQFAPGRNEQDEDALVFYLDQLDFIIDTRGHDHCHAVSDRSHHSSNSNLVYDEEDSSTFPPKTPTHNSVKVGKPLTGFIEDISDSITLEPAVGNMEVVDSAIDTIQFPFNVSEEPAPQPPPPHPQVSSNPTPQRSNQQHTTAAIIPQPEQPVAYDGGPSSPNNNTYKPHVPQEDAPFNVEIPKTATYPQPGPDQFEHVVQPPPPPVPFFVPNSSVQKAVLEDMPNSPKFTRRSIAKSNSSLNESDGHPGFARRKRDKSFRDSICSEASEASIFELSGRSRQTGHNSRSIHRAAERTQSVNSIDSCKSLVYNTVIPETRNEGENSNVSRDETPVNEPVTETTTSNAMNKADSLRKQSTAWIFNGVRNVITKFIPLPNQMHLPDDRSSDFYWDPDKKKWVDKTNDGKEEELPPPPPMASMMPMSNNLEKSPPVAPNPLSPLQETATTLHKPADSSDGPQKLPPPPQPLGNPFARGKNIMRNKYVDVLASSNQVSSTSVPQLPPMLPNNFPPPFEENKAR